MINIKDSAKRVKKIPIWSIANTLKQKKLILLIIKSGNISRVSNIKIEVKNKFE